MTSSMESHEAPGNSTVARTADGDGVFDELLTVLRAQSSLELDDAAVSEFRTIIGATIGDFLSATRQRYGQNLWQDEKFRQFATVNTRKIAKAAYARGGNRPTAADIRTAANEVIMHAHDTYCESLPSTLVPEGATPKCPVCALYIAQLKNASD